MELLGIFFFIIFSILSFAWPAILVVGIIWLVMRNLGASPAHNPFAQANFLEQYYNAMVEDYLRQLAIAIQLGQAAQAAQQRQAIENVLGSINSTGERSFYENKLSDVVNEKSKINLDTGEWE